MRIRVYKEEGVIEWKGWSMSGHLILELNSPVDRANSELELYGNSGSRPNEVQKTDFVTNRVFPCIITRDFRNPLRKLLHRKYATHWTLIDSDRRLEMNHMPPYCILQMLSLESSILEPFPRIKKY